jgi:hypothetical protein
LLWSFLKGSDIADQNFDMILQQHMKQVFVLTRQTVDDSKHGGQHLSNGSKEVGRWNCILFDRMCVEIVKLQGERWKDGIAACLM